MQSEVKETVDGETHDRLIRVAVVLAIIGMVLISVFLLRGFTPVTIALSFFLGVPILTLGVILYIVGVVRDLHRQGEL